MQTDDESKVCKKCNEWFDFSAYKPYIFCPYCGLKL